MTADNCPAEDMAQEDTALDLSQPGVTPNVTHSNSSEPPEVSTSAQTSVPGMADNVYFVISGIILITCALLATLGNGAIVAVVIKKGLPQTVTHLLVVNLAVAHLLLSLVCTPLDAGFLLTAGRWLTDDHGCRFQRFASTTFTSAAILTLSTIAVDRYYSVVYPLENKITMYKGKLMILYVWCHSVIISLPKAIVCKVQDSDRGRVVCEETWSNNTQAQIYLVFYTILTMFAPLVLTSTSYCLVWRAFRVSQRRVNVMNTLKRPKTASYLPYASKTEVRLLKMLFFMVFCFVVLWSPLVVHWFLKYFSPNTALSEYFILTSEWFCRIQPVLDPIIYGYLNKQFRKSLRDMLRVCSQCSAYYSTDVRVSTGDNNSPNSSDLYGDHFSQDGADFQDGGPESAQDGGVCWAWACTRHTTVVHTAGSAAPAGTTNELQTIRGSSTPITENLRGVAPETDRHAARATTAIESKEAPAGSISYISKTDHAPQRRASLTYHISGSVKLMPDGRDHEDATVNRPKAPVWYLGGTFPLDTNPIRNTSRLPPIQSQDSQSKRTIQRQNAINPTDDDALPPQKPGKKKRKRKKILSKRIEAKKCYSSGGVYVGPQP